MIYYQEISKFFVLILSFCEMTSLQYDEYGVLSFKDIFTLWTLKLDFIIQMFMSFQYKGIFKTKYN